MNILITFIACFVLGMILMQTKAVYWAAPKRLRADVDAQDVQLRQEMGARTFTKALLVYNAILSATAAAVATLAAWAVGLITTW